jgi:hypothetical protein
MPGIGKLSCDNLFLPNIGHYPKEKEEGQKSPHSHSPVFFWKL